MSRNSHSQDQLPVAPDEADKAVEPAEATEAAEDTEALDDLVHQLAPRLLRYCRSRLHSPSSAEDEAQHALTVLVMRHRLNQPPDNSEAFVFAVARRRCARRGIKDRFFLPLEQIEPGTHPRDPRNPEGRHLAEEARQLMLKDLNSLPRGERDALLLTAVGELGREDAAQILGISTSALKMRIHRARAKLQGRWETRHEFA